MELVVDLARVTVVLTEAADTDRLVGRLIDASTALVRADAIRFHAAGEVDDGWPARFVALCRRRPPEAGDLAPPSSGDWARVEVAWPLDRS